MRRFSFGVVSSVTSCAAGSGAGALGLTALAPQAASRTRLARIVARLVARGRDDRAHERPHAIAAVDEALRQRDLPRLGLGLERPAEKRLRDVLHDARRELGRLDEVLREPRGTSLRE